jgi:methyl-accepting chemotaxis protein
MITEIITRINSSQSAIASAVEEQSATTAEIGRSVAQAARGADGIGQDLVAVSNAAQEATTGAAGTAQAAAELARMAGTLRDLVGQFQH